jgi:hypothetical protein
LGPAPGATGSTPGAASVPEIVRGPSTRAILALDWNYPVHTAVEPELAAGITAAKTARRALTYEQAFAEIAGEDPRPLLVLRECAVCNGTDDALLSRSAENERTFLLARWFRCVKLPVDVLLDEHPYRNLFPGGTAEHLFVSTRDGGKRIALEGERSRTELWSAMLEVLSADYASDPERQLKDIQRAFDRLDAVDQRVAETQSRFDELLETEGERSSKLKKTRQKLAALQRDRDALLEEVRMAGDKLTLRKAAPAAATKEGD